MKSRNNYIYLFLMLATFLLPACENKTVYHSFLPISTEGWDKHDTLVFTFPVTDTISPLSLSIETRNTENYPFTNLFLFVNIGKKDGYTVTADTMEYMLARKNGRWTGTGIGGIYQNAYPYKTISLPHPDTLVVRICHGMSQSSFKGITDIGLHVEQ